MSKLYYYGSDDKVYGPVSELDAQGWYLAGYFSSDVRFQIVLDDKFDPNGFFWTLGELIQLNGRALPFFFSPEKAKQEKEQEETLQLLMEQIESLRTSQRVTQDKITDQGNVVELKNQVASLVETQADLLRQLNERPREKSPVDPQSDSKMSELKKKVEEHEKNFASIKKELSVLNSKCDRNDAKLEKLLEKQKEVDGAVAGCNNQISELQKSEKSIRYSLNVCEQKATSSSTKLQKITNDLSEIRKEMEEQKKKEGKNDVYVDGSRFVPTESPVEKEQQKVDVAGEGKKNKKKNGDQATPTIDTPKEAKPWSAVSELDCQGWYACGYLSSEIKFQISKCDRIDPQGRLYTLGELIDLNGRTLPFYFSQEKEDRERKQDERLNQLTQELTVLRKLYHESTTKSAEKGDVAALRSQVASLTESHSTLLLQLKELSNKKERTPPVPPNLEKNMGEQKKRLDENEKNEISAINSKCDRTETKMEKFTLKQKEVDEKLSGFDKRISSLKDAEKLIKENLKECEQTASSTSTLVQSCTSQQNEIKKEMEEQKTESATIRSNLETVKKDISYLNSAVGNIQQSAMEALLLEKIEAEKVTKMEAREVRCERKTEACSLDATEDLPPWEKEEAECPFEIETKPEDEPWNSGKKESAKTENEKSINQAIFIYIISDASLNGQKKAEVSAKTEVTTVKIPLVKDWDAICRELSDEDDDNDCDCGEDEEETDDGELDEDALEAIADDPRIQAARAANDFIHNFVALLRVYCNALNHASWETLQPRDFDIKSMEKYVSTVEPETKEHGWNRAAVIEAMRRITPPFTPIRCNACEFSVCSPLHMLYHYTDPRHTNKASHVPPKFRTAYFEMTAIVSMAFSNFVLSPSAVVKLTGHEDEMTKRGKKKALKLKKSTQFRPTNSFIDEFTKKTMSEMMDDMKKHLMNGANRVDDHARKWYKDNKQRLEATLQAHISEGVPRCAACAAAFDSIDEYYQHMTTYSHASNKSNQFTLIILILKAHEYWNSRI